MKRSILISTYLLLFIAFSISSFAQEKVYQKNGVWFRDFVQREDFEKSNSQGSVLQKTGQDQSIFPIIKEDFLVNSLEGEYGSDQGGIRTAVDGNGNRAYVWSDTRNGMDEIYAQFYDANGNKTGNNFKVNTSNLYGNNSPFIAANSKGDFVITYLINFSTVVAQSYNSSGQLINGIVFVNTTNGMNTMEPCVAVADDGSYIVMWASEPGYGGYTVYARLIDNSGNFIGQEIIVSEPGRYVSSIGQGRHIAVDSVGNYCLTWSSYTSGTHSKVYFQLLNNSGNKIGSNLLVSEYSSSVNNYYPEVASLNDGTFMFAWHVDNDWPDDDEVCWRIYNINNSFVTNVISDSTTGYAPYAVASDKQEIFYLLSGWYGTEKIWKIGSNGDKLGEPRSIDLSSADIQNIYPSEMSDVIDNKFVVPINGYDKSDANVYDRMFDTTFTPLSAINKINDDLHSSAQKYPIVTFNKFGQSIILWEDSRDGWEKLYAQLYDENFDPINGNIRIDDSQSEQWFLHIKIVKSQSDGTFVIAFSGSEEYYNDELYLQAVSTSGEKIGNNILVKSKLYDNQYKLAMDIDENDELQLCWYYGYEAMIRRFDKNLNPTTPAKLILKSTATQSFNPLTISVDKDLTLFAAWKNYNYTDQTYSNQIFGRFFDKNGNPASAIMIIDSTENYIIDIKCQNDGVKNYVLAYKDQSAFYFKRNYDLEKKYLFTDKVNLYDYTQTNINILRFENQKLFLTYNRYDFVMGFFANDNRHYSKEYEIYKYPYINYFYDEYNGINGADIFNDELMFAYESNRYGGTNNDIWANVQSLAEIDFDKEIFFEPVTSDFLYNNYPNPFNSKTKITYQLLAYHKVKLSIYDILGREVKVLVDQNQEAGIYELEFDSAGLASGVYFYRLDSFDTTIKKMMILK